MSKITAAEAKRWHKMVRDSLVELKKIFPLGAQSGELSVAKMNSTSRGRIMTSLVRDGYIRRVKVRYFAVPDKIDEAIQNEQVLSDIMWPKKVATIGEMLEEPQLDTQQLTLPPPPPVENLTRPPPGASHEEIVQWIFTLLHAQAENTIYMRERIDQLLGVDDRLKTLVDRAEKILESLR